MFFVSNIQFCSRSIVLLHAVLFPHKTTLPYLYDKFNKFTNSIQVSQQYDVKGW